MKLVMTMNSILGKIKTHHTIQKSLFINYLIPCRSEESAMKRYREIKEEHHDATHHCYAYVVGESQNHQKYFDDGEPTRSAGFPMLEVLLKQDLTDVLAVTVRYYGGINLGMGGLARAYSNSVSESIKQARLSVLTTFQLGRLRIPFEEVGHIEPLLYREYDLVHTEYLEQVTYFIQFQKDKVKQAKTVFTNQTRGNLVFDIVAQWKKYI